jgi:chromosome segregation ATPase
MTDTTSQAVVETPAPDAIATDVAPPDSSTAAVDTSEKAKPKKDGAQQRIDELTWHRRNAERRNRQLESELAQMREQLTQRASPTPEQRQEAPKKLADFNYDEEKYAEYVADIAAERAAAKLRTEQEREKTDSSRKSNQGKFREREAALRTEIEDYEDFAYTAPIHDHVADLVMSMDDGPRVAYFLGKNPETAAKLSALPPLEAAKELGRIETRLAYEREQAKAKPVSKAPPPPPKIDATEPAVDKDPEQMSDAEFAKWRKRQIAQRR